MSINIYDNGAYVRVVNSSTNVVVNYVKTTLVIQKDNSGSFFMKNDSFINYYKYCDIATPSTNSLDELIALITSWNTTSGSVSTSFDQSIVDNMSRLKVSSPLNIQLKLQNMYDVNPIQFTEITACNAISSYNTNQNSVNMNLISSAGSRIIRQSKLYPTHTYGSTSFAIVNGTLTTNNTNSNVVSKIGLFDDSNDITNGVGGNGVFFKYDNISNCALVYRTNYGGSQVDYPVLQSNWNIDILDGGGVSGKTLQFASPTEFVFEWNQVSNSNTVRAGIYGSKVHYCHVFSNMPLFGNPCLPVRWEIGHDSNLGSPNSATMVQGPATVYTDAVYNGPYPTFSKNKYGFLSLTTQWCSKPLISIRLQSEYTRAKIIPIEFELLNIAPGGIGKWSVVLNGSLIDYDWCSVSNSYAQIDYDSTDIDNGTVIASGFFYDTGVTKISLSDKDIQLLSAIDGTRDVLTLKVSLVNGTLNLTGSVTWQEKE
jgi:hypothetical protein